MGDVINLQRRREARQEGYIVDMPTPVIAFAVVIPWKPTGDVGEWGYSETARQELEEIVKLRLHDILSIQGAELKSTLI